MCVEQPGQPSPGESMGSTLEAQIKYAPAVYNSNAEYSPKYTQLALRNLSSFLKGNGGDGYIDLYTNNIMPALTNSQVAANTAIRRGNVADTAALTPALIEGERAANPQGAALVDTLTSNAARDLSYGTTLTGDQLRMVQQGVRTGAAARGMGTGYGDVMNEAFAQTGEGQRMYQQRTANVGSAVAATKSIYSDPFLAISGMGSNAGMTAGTMTGTAGQAMSPAEMQQFNPNNAMANNAMGLSYQSGAQAANVQSGNGGFAGGLSSY